MNTIDDDMDANQIWMRAWCADMRERAARAAQDAITTDEAVDAIRALELPGSEP